MRWDRQGDNSQEFMGYRSLSSSARHSAGRQSRHGCGYGHYCGASLQTAYRTWNVEQACTVGQTGRSMENGLNSALYGYVAGTALPPRPLALNMLLSLTSHPANLRVW